MLTQCETMSDLAEIKSEISSVPEYGAATGSVDSNSTTPQPHQNFAWVSIFDNSPVETNQSVSPPEADTLPTAIKCLSCCLLSWPSVFVEFYYWSE